MRSLFVKFFMAFSLIVLLATSCNKNTDSKVAALDSKADSVSTASNTSLEPVAEQKPEGPVAALQFETMDHDFGTITEGDVVEYTYSFKNTGEAPLIIENVKGSCGCTVPDWSKEPVAVGAAGFIKAKFNSDGKHDLQNKTVTITANTFPAQTVLRFKAKVDPKPADKKK